MNAEKQLQYVNRQQAERLANLGFDWELYSFYRNETEVIVGETKRNFNAQEWRDWISAPTVAHALKWCRDVKGIRCAVNYETWWSTRDNKEKSYYTITIKEVGSKSCGYYEIYEEAENALLDRVIIFLEEKNEQPH